MSRLARTFLVFLLTFVAAIPALADDPPKQGDGHEHPSAAQKRWAIAAGAMLPKLNGQDCTHLLLCGPYPEDQDPGPPPPDWYQSHRESLKKWWDVNSKEDVDKLIAGLMGDRGHHVEFDRLAAAIAKPNDPASKKVIADIKRYEDGAWKLSVVQEFAPKLGKKSIIGWDVARVITLSRQAYTAGYYTEQEAWDRILPAARMLQKTFDSWEDLGRNYIIGHRYWREDMAREQGPKLEAGLKSLLQDADSPWRRYDWRLDLSAVLAAKGDGHEHPSVAAQRWAIATDALYCKVVGTDCTHLLPADPIPEDGKFGPVAPQAAKQLQEAIRQAWGPTTKEGVDQIVTGLRDQGYRRQFDLFADALASPDSEANKKIIAAAEATPTGKYQLSVVREYAPKVGRKSIRGRDFTRLITLCRQAYGAGYYTEEEAWDRIMPAARELQKTFESWEDLAQDCLVGYRFFSEQLSKENLPAFESTLKSLLQDADSPWKRYDWKLDLGK